MSAGVGHTPIFLNQDGADDVDDKSTTRRTGVWTCTDRSKAGVPRRGETLNRENMEAVAAYLQQMQSK